MNAADLEKLLDGLHDRGSHGCMKRLHALAPTLARRVIAAEKLAEALRRISEGNLGSLPWQADYDAIRAVAAEALATFEAAQ